jgi:hypothetical protein
MVPVTCFFPVSMIEIEFPSELFTDNANFYFTETALTDCKDLPFETGKLKSVTRSNESLRGGMTHRSYRAQFEKKTVALNNLSHARRQIRAIPVMNQL